jgi:hemoglobin
MKECHMKSWRLVGSFVVLAVTVAGCENGKSDMKGEMKSSDMKMSSSTGGGGMMMQKSLYERLGGEGAITAVVDDFVGRAASDPKVNFTRKGTAYEWEPSEANVMKLKKRLVQFISMATGGPKTYQGRDMKSAHKGMMITSAEFDALAMDLAASLDKFKVPAAEKAELLKIVGSTKGDIVEKM